MYEYPMIANTIYNRIQENIYESGEKLPSIRDLAKEFNTSKQTILQAFKTLEQRHLVYSQLKSGYYVVDKKLTISPEQGRTINFTNASPNIINFPYKDFQHCIDRAFDTYQYELFNYNLSKGLDPLVKTMKELLMDYQVFSSEENIFITSGIQQALYLLCNMIFPNSKEKILIEEPTYPQIIELIKLIKLPYLTIQRADNKLDLEKIETLFSEENIKFFYVSSRFQNPLGFNLTKEEKKRVAELASQYDVYIVEDDYMADLDSDDKNDPIFYYDISDKVIYLKSFSKIMFPGLRIGVAVIPTELISEFSKHKKNSDIGSSVFSQAALDIYIKSGMFQNYKHNIKASSLDRIKSFIDSIEKHSIKEKIDYLPPKALKTHIKLPTNVHENEIISSGLNNKVILINSNDFYINIENNPKDILLIELTNLTNSQIKRGANIILDILSKKIK